MPTKNKSKLHHKLIIASVVFFGLGFAVAATPFKLVEYWLQLNNFQADGFRGQIFSHMQIAHLSDDNNKRKVALADLRLNYGWRPSFHVDLLKVGSLRFEPHTFKADSLADRIGPLLHDLLKPLGPQLTDLRVERIDINEIVFQLPQSNASVDLQNMKLVGLQLKKNYLNIESLESSGERTRIEKNPAGLLAVKLTLPKEAFTDLRKDLQIEIDVKLGQNPKAVSVRFFGGKLTLTRDPNGQLISTISRSFNASEFLEKSAIAPVLSAFKEPQKLD